MSDGMSGMNTTNEVADETTGLTLRDIEELRGLYESATAGRWFNHWGNGEVWSIRSSERVAVSAAREFVADAASMAVRDRQFIVAAHNKFERLLDVAEKYLRLLEWDGEQQ